MSYMSKNFRLFQFRSNVSVLNFPVLLFMYPGSLLRAAAVAAEEADAGLLHPRVAAR